MPKPQLIGITGRKRSGKDTAGLLLIEGFGYRRVSFADRLKKIVPILFDLDHEELTDPELKERFLDRYPYESPREILQKVGTDCLRTHYPEVWVEGFRTDSQMLINNGTPVVCTDVRFVNEALHIRARGGIIIRIDADERLGPATDMHPSETEMASITADITLPNNRSQDVFETMCLKVFQTLVA